MSVHAFAAGILGPDELKLLREVFEETAPIAETELEREERAARLLGYFQAGVRDRVQLIALAKVRATAQTRLSTPSKPQGPSKKIRVPRTGPREARVAPSAPGWCPGCWGRAERVLAAALKSGRGLSACGRKLPGAGNNLPDQSTPSTRMASPCEATRRNGRIAWYSGEFVPGPGCGKIGEFDHHRPTSPASLPQFRLAASY